MGITFRLLLKRFGGHKVEGLRRPVPVPGESIVNIAALFSKGAMFPPRDKRDHANRENIERAVY